MGSIIGNILAVILGAWAEREVPHVLNALAKSLIIRAVGRLPERDRELYREEWFAVLDEIQSPTLKLLNGLSLWWKAGAVAESLGAENKWTRADVFDRLLSLACFVPIAPLLLIIVVSTGVLTGKWRIGRVYFRNAKGQVYQGYGFRRDTTPAWVHRLGMSTLPALMNVIRGEWTFTPREGTRPAFLPRGWSAEWQAIMRIFRRR